MKFKLSDGRELWTLAMDDGKTVMVRTYMPDGSTSTYYYAAADDGLYRYTGYNDGTPGELVIGNQPQVGDSAWAARPRSIRCWRRACCSTMAT